MEGYSYVNLSLAMTLGTEGALATQTRPARRGFPEPGAENAEQIRPHPRRVADMFRVFRWQGAQTLGGGDGQPLVTGWPGTLTS